MNVPRLLSNSSLAALALAATSVTASADLVVPYDNPLIPTGLAPGDSFHLLFVTSTAIQRDLLDGSDDGSDDSTIGHWDAHVNTVAGGSTVPEMASVNWFAIVSVDNLSDGSPGIAAKDHAVVSAPVYRTDGVLVANDLSDLWDGSIAAYLNVDESGNTVTSGTKEAWTGDASNYSSPGVIGTSPLGNGSESAQTGVMDSLSAWHSYGGHFRRGPNDSRRVYALSERITIEVPDDTDGDDLPDWYELEHTDPSSDTALNAGDDLDEDGLTNLQEYQVAIPLDPNEPDSDGDGLLDGASITVTSGDSRYAAWAAAGIAYSDSAGDRTFRGELTMGTGQNTPDTDGDGLLDGPESNTGTWVSAADTGTDPLEPDSDDDGLRDGVETNSGTYVDETNTGTNPLLADTDGDGAGDWYEISASFTDPSVTADNPGVPYPLPDPDATPPATDKPVKVFILSGQSNMVGIGYVNGPKPGSLDAVTKVDGKFPNLLDGVGEYLPRNDVWYEGVVTATAKKWLAPGCGNGSSSIGPELGFGQVMGWHHAEPVLIIKASQGNRGIGWDILPPGSTQYEWTNGKTYPGYGESPQDWLTASETESPAGWYAGKQYDDFFLHESDMGARAWAAGIAYPVNCQVTHNGWTYISTSAHTSAAGTAPQVDVGGDPVASAEWDVYAIDNVADVLDNFDTRFEDWAAQGFEIAGYAWFQGHWDQSEPYASKYEENLVQLINETRSYYENRYPGQVSPKAPFAVATIGFGGQPYVVDTPSYKVHAAQLAVGDPVQHPEYDGNVKSVDTLPYWRELDESPGIQGYHYNNNAETYLLIGDALGRAMLNLLDDETAPFPDPLTFEIPPSAVDATTVGMVATTASDSSVPVEYYFENITNSDNSGWIPSPSWNNTGLGAGTYSYHVKARDAEGNETGWSDPASGSPGIDGTAPSPAPSFASGPTALGESSISMTSTTAADINGVEYEFVCTVGGGPGSGWQASPEFTATSLSPGTEYTYVVRARDSVGNTTADSAPASATTTVPDVTDPDYLTLSPADGTTDVAVGTNLVVTFDETIMVGSGNITLKNLSDSIQSTIDITDGTQVTIAGAVLTINPATDLAEGKNYAIQIDATAIDDLVGNSFAGIVDDTTWNITTADPPPVDGYVIAADSPLIPAGLGPGSSFQLVFVTSTKTNRDSGGGSDDYPISYWDSYVNSAATGSTLPDVPNIKWRAMVSVDNLSDANPGIAARDHAVISETVYRTDGALVASGFADMWDGQIAVPIQVDESGNDLGSGSASHREVWTGDASNYSSAGVIGAYPLGNGANSTQTGDMNRAAPDNGWHSFGAHIRRGVGDSRRLYALSEVITVAGGSGGNDFTDWIAGYDVGPQTGFNQDPDGDGIESGLENFFGTHPGEFTVGLVAGAVTTGGTNTFTFTHPQSDNPADDVSGAIYRWSKDLETFYGDGLSDGTTAVSLSAQVDTPVTGTTTVTATIAGPAPDKLFVEVGVTQAVP